MLELIKKNRMLLMYFIMGVLTTAINIIVFDICYYFFRTSNIFSNVVAWIIAVLFAFFTNKLYVFESKSFEKKKIIYELFSFFGCRVLTGLLDLAVMWITVDKMQLNAFVMKCISNGIVIVLNYIASKLFIFKENV